MPHDVQIRLGDGGAPQAYEVPNATEIIVKAVTATFDGSGAAGNFKPTLEIVSDGGVVMARVPCETEVSAGGSAEVTFAPFLRAAASATPSTSFAPWVLFTLGWGPTTFPASGSEMPFTTPRSSFGATFTVDGLGHLVLPQGLWLLYSSMQLIWEAVDSPPPYASTFAAYDVALFTHVSSTIFPLAGTPVLLGAPDGSGGARWNVDYILWADMNGSDTIRIRNDSDAALNATGAGPAVAELEFMALQVGSFV